MYDTLVVGGRVLTPGGWRRRDLFVDQGRICGLAVASRKQRALARQVIDARDCLVLPGAIDAHVHLALQIGPSVRTADDFATGTRAAAAAGVTTIIDYTTPEAGQSPWDAFCERRRLADGAVGVDYGLHNVLIDYRSGWEQQLRRLASSGAPSIKLFTIYAERGWRCDDGRLLHLMQVARRNRLLLCLHAENHELISWFSGRLAGRSAAYLAQARPAISEIESVRRALLLARHSRCHLHLVHLSCGESAAAVAEARQQGLPVSGETCPQYLSLEKKHLQGRRGYLWTCCPPLRHSREQAGLWRALRRGWLQAVTTDHCAFTVAQKQKGRHDFTKSPYGLPGLEVATAVTHTLGPGTGRLSRARWWFLHSEGPARRFGLWPRKGCLAPGSDADVVVWDPRVHWRARPETLETAVDWSPYRGLPLVGRARLVMLRGRVVARDGRYCGRQYAGRFVKRGRPEKP